MFISSSEVSSRISMDQAIMAVEGVIARLGRGHVGAPVSLGVAVDRGTFHVKACAAANPGAANLFVAKVNANFPGNPAAGRPTIQGLITVFDAQNGEIRAIVDSPSITSLRTAATTGMVIRHLAPLNAQVATVIGCGALGRYHVAALKACGIGHVYLFDTDFARASAAVAWAEESLSMACDATENLRRATLQSQIVITCTPSTQPFLGVADVRPGTLIAAVGADNECKAEIESALLDEARIVTDLTTQCLKYGDLRRAPLKAVSGELTDVVADRVARTAPNEIVIFDSTGLAVQDLALCELLVSTASI